MKYMVNDITFESVKSYLDVEIMHEEKWINLTIDTTDSFPIQSQEELDYIYKKLSKIFKEFKKESIEGSTE